MFTKVQQPKEEPMKDNRTSTAITTTSFLAQTADNDAVVEALRENLGGSPVQIGDLERLKIPTGGGTTWLFATAEGEIARREFSAVVISQKSVRSYYAKKFSGGGEPPTCFSDDGMVGVGEPGGVCSACPFSARGSALDDLGNPTKGSACKQRLLLLLALPDSPLPVILSLPPSSLAAWRKYLYGLVKAGRGISKVVTAFKLEVAHSASGIKYAKIAPAFERALAPEEVSSLNGIAQMFQQHLSNAAEDEEAF